MILASSALVGCTDTGVHLDVSYDQRFGEATTMDIHVPQRGTDRPAVMLIHGGAWRYGDKANYTDAAERLAGAGYVAATINYRLLPSAMYPAPVQDCLCALAFLRANAASFGLAPDRIAVMGYSAGGHLTALLGTNADDPAHQPDCASGPTTAPNAVIPGDSTYLLTEGHGFTTDFLGGTEAEVPERYISASPLLHVRAGSPPFLVMHGVEDVVPIDTAHALVAAIRDVGSEASLLEIEGAGHIHSPTTATGGTYLQAASDTPEAWAATFDFLAHSIGAP